ncbi:M97 protein [Murid betaherpesvirus 1]|nr:M97 protein [Murid betaherpesvirus 1]
MSVELTPPRSDGSVGFAPVVVPPAPRKPLRRRAVSDLEKLYKVKRRLVFGADDGAVDNETSNNNSGSSSTTSRSRRKTAADVVSDSPKRTDDSTAGEDGYTHCVHSCACTPGERHLLCCELVSIGDSVSVARCPLCSLGISTTYLSRGCCRGRSKVTGGDEDEEDEDEEENSQDEDRDEEEAAASASSSGGLEWSDDSNSALSWSDESVIISPFPGLKCYVTTFEDIRQPVLLETGSAYLPVYAPYDESFCRNRCLERGGDDDDERDATLIGKGSFGQVWRLSDKKTALKAAASESINETLLTVWISGVVRSRAQDAGYRGELDDSVYCNILVATGSCLRHNLVSFASFDRDLYNYRGWHYAGLASYRRAFSGIADALRFLNLRCGVGHFDVTPMNVLINYDRADDRQIARAVICDFSLSQCHTEGTTGHCVVVFQQTKTVRALPKSAYYLTDIYHPAFKPLMLQKLCAIEPRKQFPKPSANRFCVSDLCALGHVAAFCLVRVLDERGQLKVRSTSEDALFGVARKTCDALARHSVDEVANFCSLLITRQLAYTATLLGSDDMREPMARLCDYFETVSDKDAPDRFRSVYKRARREIDGSYMVRLLLAASETEDGRYLLDNIRATCLMVDSEDLDVDPYKIFP